MTSLHIAIIIMIIIYCLLNVYLIIGFILDASDKKWHEKPDRVKYAILAMLFSVLLVINVVLIVIIIKEPSLIIKP